MNNRFKDPAILKLFEERKSLISNWDKLLQCNKERYYKIQEELLAIENQHNKNTVTE